MGHLDRDRPFSITIPAIVSQHDFYHRISHEAAAAIIASGFRDGSGTYGNARDVTGVWISNVPLDENEGACGDVLLAVEAPDVEAAALGKWEWVGPEWQGYRESLVPAEWINRVGSVRNEEIREEPTF